MGRVRSSFWKSKSFEELAKEQGVQPVTEVSKVIGAGRSLWKSDAEFKQFLSGSSRPKRRQRV